MRSYKIVAAVVLALVLLAPLLGLAAAKAFSPLPGAGKIYTKVVSVNGVVQFDFNLTPAYQGAEAHIYLSANGLPNVYYGDVPITHAFSTSNVTAVLGNITISASEVHNFLKALYDNGPSVDAASGGETKETVVYHNLTTQGWALVYLKYSTSAPVQYGGSAPAIAAGPFNLTIRPMISVTIKPANNVSYVPISGVPTSSQASLNVTGTNALVNNIIDTLISTPLGFQLSGSYSNISVTTAPLTIYNSLSHSSGIFSPVSVIYKTSPSSINVSGSLVDDIILPALTKAVMLKSGALESYFNTSLFSLAIIDNTTSVTVGTTSQAYVELEPSGSYFYGTGQVTFHPMNYSFTNYGVSPSTYGPYGLFNPSPSNGTLNIFPSFSVSSVYKGVSGPTTELNPGDELELTFYDVPYDTGFVGVTAIGNGTVLPTSPYLYPAEENSESYYTSQGYYVASLSMYFTNGSFVGPYPVSITDGTGTVYALVPNAPYYPFAYLGLEYEVNYTPQLVSGSISKYGFITNDTLYHSGALSVYPFYQVFTSNANGMMLNNDTLVLGNYLLVRGFGFTTTLTPSEYPVMTYSTYSSTLAPITPVESDGYGDFAYISQVPISGPLYLNVFSMAPGDYTVTVSSSVFTSVTTNQTSYTVIISEYSGNAIVYVNPTPEVFPPTPIVSGLLGEIVLPSYLVKYPYEATIYITNESTPLIPASEGEIHEVVVAGAGFTANVSTGKYGSVLLKFYIESNASYYYGSVNVSQVAPFGDSSFSGTWVLGGYGVFNNVPVPDLPGNAGWMTSSQYPYMIAITNVTSSGTITSEPASTMLYVGKAGDLLLGTYSLAYFITNSTTGGIITVTSPLTSQPILVLPGVPVTAYVFGSPISKPTDEALPVNFTVSAQCGVATKVVPLGYIINGTLFSNFTGVYVKGSTLSAGTTLPLCPGYNELSFQLTGPYVPTGTIVTYPSTPVTLTMYYVEQIPTIPVQFSVTAPGTASVGVPVEVLVSKQVSVLGLPASEASTFFTVSAPQVTAYIANASGVYPLPASSVRFVAAIPGFDVYYVTLPSTVANGTVDIIVTVTAAYKFDPSAYTFTGQAAATSGIVSVNTQAINNEIASAESQVASLIQSLNASIKSEISGAVSTLSSQVQSEGSMVASEVEGLNASIQSLSSAVMSLNSTISSEMSSAVSTISGYLYGNFSYVNSSISTIEFDLTNVGGQVGALASDVNTVESDVSSLSSSMTALASSIQSINSTLSSATSTISGVASSLSSLSSTVSSISSTVNSMSSTLSGVSSTLSSLSSTVSGMQGTLSSMQSTLSTISSTASSAESSAHSASSAASSAATYSLGALIVAIIALALIAYVAFAKF